VTLGEAARGPDALLAAWATAIGILMMLPPSLLPGLERASESGADKTGHFVVFLVLALLAIASARRRTRYPVIVALAACILYGAVLEALQSVMGMRSADLADLAADGLGSWAGVVLQAVWRRS